MKDLFNPDGRFFAIMEPVADMMILNLLFLTTSLPLITVGTSLTALCSVVMKQAEGTSSHVVKEYFYAWKSNFKQSCKSTRLKQKQFQQEYKQDVKLLPD